MVQSSPRRRVVSTTYARVYSPPRSGRGAALRRTVDNFSYSYLRRELEHSHVRAPFEWEDWEYAQEEGSSSVGLPRSNIKECAAHRKKHHRPKQHDSYETEENNNSGSSSGSRSSLRSWDEPKRCRSARQPKAAAQVQESRTRAYEKPWQQNRPRTCPAPRASVEDLKRNHPPHRIGKSLAVEGDPPLLPYGMVNTAVATGGQRTHNVLASPQGVYPAALRAKKRQACQVAVSQESAQSAPYREKRRVASFNDDFDAWMNRRTAGWRSEYNRRYPGYDRSEYAKHMVH